MLTKLQKASLCQIAAKAFAFQDSLGLVDAAPSLSRSAQLTQWRREQTKQACGLSSLSEASQRHYLTIRAHFEQLAGDDGAAFNTYYKQGDGTDSAETRAAVIYQIRSAVTDHTTHYAGSLTSNVITLSYIESIAFAQYKKSDLTRLTTTQLTRLYYTTRNRIAAREGRGSSQNRNKTQRTKKSV